MIDNGKIVALAIAVIFVVSIVSALMLPHEEITTPQYVSIEKIDVKIEDVKDDTVDLTFLIKLRRSDVLSNTTLRFYVYDLKTDILLKEKSVAVPKKDGREINATLSFDKDKDYRVEINVEKDNKTVDSRILRLRYLDTLIPKDKELKVVLKDVDFKIVAVEGDKVTATVRFYLDSMKDYDVDFHIKAIQYESNVLADEKWIKAKLESGKTKVVEANLTVPKDYNYLIKLEAWRNGALLKIWKETLNLAPTKRIPKEEVEKEVKFEVEKFVKTPQLTSVEGKVPQPTPAPVGGFGVGRVPSAPAPGFEALALIVAGGVAICLRKRLSGRF